MCNIFITAWVMPYWWIIPPIECTYGLLIWSGLIGITPQCCGICCEMWVMAAGHLCSLLLLLVRQLLSAIPTHSVINFNHFLEEWNVRSTDFQTCSLCRPTASYKSTDRLNMEQGIFDHRKGDVKGKDIYGPFLFFIFWHWRLYVWIFFWDFFLPAKHFLPKKAVN